MPGGGDDTAFASNGEGCGGVSVMLSVDVGSLATVEEVEAVVWFVFDGKRGDGR